jgi:hypothetical protein
LTITKDVDLAYLDYSKVFETYTDDSSNYLGAIITQDNRPIAFLSWKLSNTQHKYSVTKIELLAMVRKKRVQRDAMGPKHKSVY